MLTVTCTQWTVHMFSIFSLRQPDVLGVGDLGLQKVIQMQHPDVSMANRALS